MNKNLVCPYDDIACSQYNSSGCTMDIECKDCCRYFNGARATGATPGLDAIIKWIKKKLYRHSIDMKKYAELENKYGTQG